MYWLNHGSNISQGVAVPEQKFGGSQVDPGVAVLNGRVWVVTDQVTSAAGFPPRGWFAATAFNGRLWVSGGGSAGIDRNDVWSSPDGVNWTGTTAAAASRPREQHQMVV
jgi:hypothetical protein